MDVGAFCHVFALTLAGLAVEYLERAAECFLADTRARGFGKSLVFPTLRTMLAVACAGLAVEYSREFTHNSMGTLALAGFWVVRQW